MSNTGPGVGEKETVSWGAEFIKAAIHGDLERLKSLNEKCKPSDFIKGLAAHSAIKHEKNECEVYLIDQGVKPIVCESYRKHLNSIRVLETNDGQEERVENKVNLRV